MGHDVVTFRTVAPMSVMSRGHRRAGSVRGGVGAVSVAGLVLSGLAFAAPAHAEGEVPILGQVQAKSSDDTPDTTLDVLISLHGVRRVDNATMVYYSVGYTPDSTPGSTELDLLDAFGFKSNLSPLHDDAQQMGDVAVLDVAGRKAYTPLYTGEDYTDLGNSDCVCSDWLYSLPEEPKPGTAYVGAAALPTIPKDLDTATVRVLGQFFTDVPVEDGPMGPQKPTDEPIVAGKGWPKVDSKAIQDVPDPSQFVLPLTTHQVVDDSALSQRSDADSRSLDLSADVLFAVDEATLTGEAKKEIRAAAGKIKDAKVKGTIKITGHTDSSGEEGYNKDLSERRAESVARALKPLLPSGAKMTTAGKGESDPIASNETEDGKSLNRRVTITLPGAK